MPTTKGFAGQPVQGTLHPLRTAGGPAPGLTPAVPPPRPAACRQVPAANAGQSGESSTDASNAQDGRPGLQGWDTLTRKVVSPAAQAPSPSCPSMLAVLPQEGRGQRWLGLAWPSQAGGWVGAVRREQGQLPSQDPDSRDPESALGLFPLPSQRLCFV